MTIKAVFFDFGGVIQRTEFQAPRQHLAERFGMDYDDIDKLVFGSPSARQATAGQITEETHWQEVLKRLKVPVAEKQNIETEFFGGDVIDRELVEYIRSLKGRYHTGLISNAWSGMRAFLEQEHLIELFDTVIISSEIKVAKPDAEIYQLALEKAGINAEDAIFVDDAEANIEACEEIGMMGIMFRDQKAVLRTLGKLLDEK